MKYYFLYLLTIVSACVPIQSNYTSSSYNSVNIDFTDKIYDNNIKTVQLYPTNNISDQTSPSVINILNDNLVLEFDEMVEDANTYNAKIYNCTANWKRSNVSAIEYLYEYNEFDIQEYEYSLDTDFPYVHYRFNVPKVKTSGNYLLVVYRNGNENEVILTKRFMVFENKLDIIPAQTINGLVNLSRKNQQIEFFVRYKNFPIDNPRESIKVQLRQNNRWDNLLHGIRPSFIREDVNELEYRFINNSDLFKGGNEFRFFDFRSIKYPGYRIKSIVRENNEYHVQVANDKMRADLAYSQYRDKNGKYFIFNQDFDNSASSSNYAKVNFFLSDKKMPSNAQIYLFGSLTNYELSPQYQLKHNENKKSYELEVLLKQGHYDYQYYYSNDSTDYNYIEGNYFETENEYEILVYYRPFGAKTDLLIGYKVL
ncbi:MAG: DUF5103 domain-containing protein [Cyclobacteriaceae bacterium]|nr:DUF5103 domain-containing protein [Cyclobacteriaceae bacterium]